ncbi:Cyrochrome P450 monooxygenase, partial [Lachnellula willkommii]
MAVFPNLQMHWIIGVLVILGLAVVVVRRLYFSPLSKFPGPKLAAATILYEAYYDVIKYGQYTFKIKELHKKYGGCINVLSQYQLRRQVQQTIDDQNAQIKNTDGLPRTIFQSLLDSNLPPEDKTVERLRQEGQLLLGAGSDTVANTLSITTFHLVDNPEKMLKLARELEKAMPDPNEPAELTLVEQLPYLTPVGMSAPLMHHDESIFPDSYAFIPERWLDQSESARPLDRYMVAFSKGKFLVLPLLTIHANSLAKAELYLTLATVFRRYKVELFDTVRERDVDLKHDNFLPFPSHKSRGIRAIF